MSTPRVTSLVLMFSSVLFLAGCSCPPGFLHFRDSCYWFSNIEANFAEARSYCGFLKSRLVVITSKEEDDFVRGIAKDRAERHLLGATDLGQEGIWRWEKGLEMTYTNWGPGQPNNHPYEEGENCLELWPGVDYKWNDAECSVKHKFICETCYD